MNSTSLNPKLKLNPLINKILTLKTEPVKTTDYTTQTMLSDSARIHWMQNLQNHYSMKKIYKLILLLMFITLSTNLMATDYMVSGAGTTAANGTYAPDGANMFGAPRWKHSAGVYYLQSDGMNQWVINTDGNMPFGGDYRNMTQSPFDQNIPPFTGWQTDMGNPPAPTVGEAGPSLSYSSGTFSESSANNGSVDNSQPVIITHNVFAEEPLPAQMVIIL